MSSALNHYHDGIDGSMKFNHGNLLNRSTHSECHPIYLRGLSINMAEEHGKVSFTAGVSSIAVVFGSVFAAIPVVIPGIERTAGSSVQSADIEAVTTSGFTLKRSSSGGAATGTWFAIGSKA